jgi:hypothetical protein
MSLKVNDVAHLLGESRWTAAALFKTFAFPWRPVGPSKKHKRVLLADLMEWVSKNTASNPAELRALLDQRSKDNRTRKALA